MRIRKIIELAKKFIEDSDERTLPSWLVSLAALGLSIISLLEIERIYAVVLAGMVVVMLGRAFIWVEKIKDSEEKNRATRDDIDEMKSLHRRRVNEIEGEETPVKLLPEGKWIVHIFSSRTRGDDYTIDIGEYVDREKTIQPMFDSRTTRSRHERDYTIDENGGTIYRDRGERTDGYTTLFRDGTVESVQCLKSWNNMTLVHDNEDGVTEDITRLINTYKQIMKDREVKGPFYIFVSATSGGEYFWHIIDEDTKRRRRTPKDKRGEDFDFNSQRSVIKKSRIEMPYLVIIGEEEIRTQLRKMIKVLWNTFGYRDAYNYDTDENSDGRQ